MTRIQPASKAIKRHVDTLPQASRGRSTRQQRQQQHTSSMFMMILVGFVVIFLRRNVEPVFRHHANLLLIHQEPPPPAAAAMSVSDLSHHDQEHAVQSSTTTTRRDTTGILQQQPQPQQQQLMRPDFLRTGMELRPYCEDTTKFFNIDDLEPAVERLRAFHTQGGALRSVQQLLDRNIDSTVAKLGAKFVPTSTTNHSNSTTTSGEQHAGEGVPSVTKYLRDYYAANFDPRGGYGNPLPGKYQKLVVDSGNNHNKNNHNTNDGTATTTEEDEEEGIPLIFSGRWVNAIDPESSKERWDYGLGPLGPKCPNLKQLGQRTIDGIKWYCQPKQQQQPQQQQQQQQQPQQQPQQQQEDDDNDDDECHVISIGGNDQWKFEKRVVIEMRGCITHTFDCTLPRGKPLHKPNRQKIKFYNYCIDGYRHTDIHGRQYITYFDMIQIANLTKPPTLFKMDVEGFEYDIFTHMIQQANTAQSSTLPNSNANANANDSDEKKIPLSYWLPQQIMVELHWATRMSGVSWMPRTRTTAEIALLSNMMYSGGGYMPIFQDWHRNCPACIEILYFRALC